MDANKSEKLVQIGYRILSTCSLCRNGRFINGSDYGVCIKFGYFHLRHGNTRELSIHRSGSCGEFEYTNELKGGWEEFR